RDQRQVRHAPQVRVPDNGIDDVDAPDSWDRYWRSGNSCNPSGDVDVHALFICALYIAPVCPIFDGAIDRSRRRLEAGVVFASDGNRLQAPGGPDNHKGST